MTVFWPMTSLSAAITSKRRLGHPSRLYFLNPECVRIPWVIALKNFPVENFRIRSDVPKKITFSRISVHTHTKKCSRLMCTQFWCQCQVPSLKRYTTKFSGPAQKLAWCQRFGVQVLPKSGNSDSCTQK